MKKLFFLLFMILPFSVESQTNDFTNYDAGMEFPYGQKNPSAPEELNDFAPMIGTCKCKSLNRNPDGTWQDTVPMIWTFKYIMNGTAIQDMVWRDNSYASSIRMFRPDSMVWVVSYHSVPGKALTTPTWTGTKQGEDIVLTMPQKAPNGMDGISRLTFTDISENGFHWRGEWVNEENDIIYPFWLIWCKKE